MDVWAWSDTTSSLATLAILKSTVCVKGTAGIWLSLQ